MVRQTGVCLYEHNIDEPGSAYDWYVVSTDDADALRKELLLLGNLAKREFKVQVDKTKSIINAQRDLVNRGEQGCRLLCTIKFSDEIDSFRNRYEIAAHTVLWVWTGLWRQPERHSGVGASTVDDLRLARAE